MHRVFYNHWNKAAASQFPPVSLSLFAQSARDEEYTDYFYVAG